MYTTNPCTTPSLTDTACALGPTVFSAMVEDETNFDAEPSIAVNPANPKEIVVTAFTPDIDPRLGERGPIFYSTDSGSTWEAHSVIPGGVPGDISVRFGGASGALYTEIIHAGDDSLNVLRTTDFTAPDAMELLLKADTRPVFIPDQGFQQLIVDQPWVEATASRW